MLANRMKPFLNDIISQTQSAFVPRRLITDNVLVAFEVNHFLKCRTRGKNQFMALKLDVSKAYDRVEWSFLRRILIKMGFASSFVEIIMMCVSTVSYSFLLNGKQFGALQPGRGLRQGDPLSPYLFICCTEAFIRLVENSVNQGRLHGVRVAPYAPVISNLCFADDTILFCQATVNEAEEVRRILEKYAHASGQLINLEKSSMVFSPGTLQVVRTQIQGVLGIQIVEKFDKYLGLPAVVGRSKKEVFNFLKDRVWDRIRGWHERDFSMAGREVLIKAVLQAVPTYVMSCFLLPLSLVQEIEQMVRQYWWGGNNTKSLKWFAWNRLCRSKENGGMGFRNLESFNKALLMKQAWRLVTSPDILLSRIFKARYFPHGTFFTAETGDRPSMTWRGILSVRGCLLRGLQVRIGNGMDTAIWGDSWLLPPSRGKVITTRPQHLASPNCVGDLIDWNTYSWNYELLSSTFWPVDVHHILQVPFGSPETADRLVWAFSKSGVFTVRSCYHSILEEQGAGDRDRGSAYGMAQPQWKWIWKLRVPPKVRNFLWRACHDIIPTRAALFRRRVGSEPFCEFCKTAVETESHIFFHCPFFVSI